jgi:hypothetical protein
VPAATPVTTPAAETTAFAVLLLLQVPPDTLAVRLVAVPAQTVGSPKMSIEDESAFTVTVLVATAVPQPLETVYDITAVPAATPVTTPELLIVAIPVEPELQVPPLTALLSVVVPAMLTVDVPVMVPADGAALTVTIFVAVAVPQPLETA